MDTAFDDGVKIGREEGVKLGHEAGLQEGVKLGHETSLQEGVKLGHETGLQEGRQEGVYLTAKNMLTLGMDIDTIAKCTGLTRQQIESL